MRTLEQITQKIVTDLEPQKHNAVLVLATALARVSAANGISPIVILQLVISEGVLADNELDHCNCSKCAAERN